MRGRARPFFVVSGFVITGMLLRELSQTATISLVSFYARRLRRLLPALALTSVVVIVASAFLLSQLIAEHSVAR